MAYNEIYMQEQNHPAWKNDRMKPSSARLGAKGCFIDCVRYAWSRLNSKMLGLAEANAKMSAINGYTMNGDAKWDAIRKALGLIIYNKRPTTSKTIITMRNVLVRGRDNALFSHWVTELRGGLMFDPLRAGGKFVHPITFYSPVFIKPGVINRRWITKA
jgi:hypothetical protein